MPPFHYLSYMEWTITLLGALLTGALITYLILRKILADGRQAHGEAQQLRAQLETENRLLRDDQTRLMKASEEDRKAISLMRETYLEAKLQLSVAQTEKVQSQERCREIQDQLQLQNEREEDTRRLLEKERLAHAATLEAWKHATEKLETQKADLEKVGTQFEHAFGSLAQKILDDRSKKFGEEQEKNMKMMLEPLQKEIAEFKIDIGVKQKQESDERISLREAVKHITTLNQTLSEQAERLTETLRLQVKQQGDWGESILESILEHSGLQKGLQYFTQQGSRNADGQSIRPDVVVRYPDERKIVIDSKVSLVNYYDLCGCIPGEEDGHKSLMVRSFKSHIDELAAKNYGDIQDALDFVIMFVPVEPAYITVMHTDPALWQYAYKKRILLISPANLVATLKLVEDMWRKDAIDKNAQAIAQKAGKIYDKLESFVENFERVGDQLQKATGSWEDARKQLISGRGNLLRQAVHMKQLHIDNRKDIAPELEQEALLNGGHAGE